MLSSNHTAGVTYEPITYTISGNAGVAGASISFTGGTPVLADGAGEYSFTVPYNWSGTATPSLTGYTFDPVSRDYVNVLADQINQDYTATPITYTISGNAGVAGATISFTGGTPVLADGSGDYSFIVPHNWSGTVTPSLAEYTFDPVSRDYVNVLADEVNQDYTATHNGYTISGNAGVAGATISFTGGTPSSPTALETIPSSFHTTGPALSRHPSQATLLILYPGIISTCWPIYPHKTIQQRWCPTCSV